MEMPFMDWEPYIADNPDLYIPIAEWDKDHWSTLAYLESVAVNHHGLIENDRMRCNSRLHRVFLGERIAASGIANPGKDYPTRLKGGKLQDKHDDWSCLEDMCSAGLIDSWFKSAPEGQMFGGAKAVVSFTERGLKIAEALRRHKAAGGTFSNFILSPELEAGDGAPKQTEKG
jgi:hypothetical protein